MANLDQGAIEHHPERAKLALLIAVARMQLSDPTASRLFLHLAKRWGCSKNLIARMLISGVHNTLGKASAVMGKEQRAFDHLQAAVQIGIPGAEARLLIPARISLQLSQLGLPGIQASLLSNAWNQLAHTLDPDESD